MKILARFLVLVAIAGSICHADIPAGWSTDYLGTIDTKRPALLYFTASWCGPCKLMSRTTLADPAVRKTISDIPHVAIDIDEHPDLATRQNVSAVPTFVMVTPAGDEVERTTGYQSSTDFMKWLGATVAEANAAMARQALSKKVLADVDQLLSSTGAASTQQAASKLFDLCDERDSAIVTAAADRLKTIAARDPAALLDGLADPRLAPRIQVANILQSKIGDSFDIDPWSDAATRAAKIRAWQSRLHNQP